MSVGREISITTRLNGVRRSNPGRHRSSTVTRLRALARRGVTLAELSLGQKMEQAEHKLGATTSLAIAIDHLEEHGPGYYLKSRKNPVKPLRATSQGIRRDRYGRFR